MTKKKSNTFSKLTSTQPQDLFQNKKPTRFGKRTMSSYSLNIIYTLRNSLIL